MNGQAILRLAEAIATVAHDGTRRKAAGEPYIEHCWRVANAVKGWEYKTVAWLHDTIEDTYITVDALHGVGIPPNLVYSIIILTKPNQEGTHYRDYIQRILGSDDEIARQVKLADLRDNLSSIDELPLQYASLRPRYEHAIAILEGKDA